MGTNDWADIHPRLTKNTIKNAKLWVEALESGEYTQCGEMLADDNGGNCCLGVAWDSLKDGYWKLEEDGPSNQVWTAGGYEDFLESKWALRTLGLSTFDQSELAELNDNSRDFVATTAVIRKAYGLETA